MKKKEGGNSVVDADGHIEISAKGLPKIGFHIGNFDKENKDPDRVANEKHLIRLFQKLQDEIDKGNPVAVQLVKDIAETNMPSHISLNPKLKNQTDMRDGVNFNFLIDKEYPTKDGAAKYTPERIFSHEIAHLAGEKTTENRENKMSIGDRSVFFNPLMTSDEERIHRIEEPAVKAENYICEKIFGAAACGPARESYQFPKAEEKHG